MDDIDRREARHRDGDQTPSVVMPWLVRLRWASVVALVVAAWAAYGYWRVRLPIAPLVVLLAALAATNAALTFQLRSPAPRRRVIEGVLLVDVALLTGIRYLVGGPVNPFGIVYLVIITVAAVALGYRWAILLGVISNAAYGLTSVYYRPLEFIGPSDHGAVMAMHLSGMWVAFAAASGLIACFVSRISDALAEREHELDDARAAAARHEQMAALFSLGAGAAHELATPLSTIRTAAAELDRAMAHTGRSTATDDYVAVICAEVDRCTQVLDQLSGRAAAASSADSQVWLPNLVDDLRYRLGESFAHRLDVAVPPGARRIDVPAEPLRQALVALLRNAFDASDPEQRVAMTVRCDDGLHVEIVDHGRGMDDTELARADEPFFTTKPAGAGLGLGLFLVRAFADQMGGALTLRSRPGGGTSAVLHVPIGPERESE